MENNMSNYRKITSEELVSFVKKNSYIGLMDDVPIEDVCEMAPEFFGPKVRYIILNYDDEYNDSGYDLRVSSITAYDENNSEIELTLDVEDYKLSDKYHDWRYSLKIGAENYDGGRCLSDVKIDIKEKRVVPDESSLELYVKVD
jgi:hypothetical protein